MEVRDQRVLVLGLGRSGRSAAEFCAEQGARVVVADEGPGLDAKALSERYPEVEILTNCPFPDPADFDLVVPSPGIAGERFQARARRIAGDIELAHHALRVPIVAVTGTNGKSTTTLLIEALLRAAGLRARAAGNLGVPALSLVGEPLDVAVLEVSSFQLESTETFRPRVAVLTNLAPDHLDRYPDFAAYMSAKRRILANQRAEDTAVLNFDDPHVRAMAQTSAARIMPFARSRRLKQGVFTEGDALVYRGEEQLRRFPTAGFRLREPHNVENAAGALAAVAALGVDLAGAEQILATFGGLPHRCEVLSTRQGVTFVNDSKATNPAAALRALTSFNAPIVWLAGGRNKGGRFEELNAVTAARVRLAILFGEAAGELKRHLQGNIQVHQVASLGEAVRQASEVAQAGDVVLLSPACASFDAFANFEARGDYFRHEVDALGANGGNARRVAPGGSA